MAAAKRTAKSKLISEDVSAFMNQSQYLKDSPKNKGSMRRQRADKSEEEEMSKVIGQYQATLKKKKVESNVEVTTEYRQQILDLVDHQLEARKQCRDNLFMKLAEITTQAEADYNMLKENDQKLGHLTETYMTCMQQSTSAYKQKLKALKEIPASFKNDESAMESEHKAQTIKLIDELEYDIKKLQDKFIKDGKKSSWESLRRSLFHAKQNDF